MSHVRFNSESTVSPSLYGPARSGYSLSGLAELKQRLLSPPQVDLETGAPTVGRIRTLQRVCVTELNLDDLLHNKYQPPFQLRQFEDYLLYQERSAENLYATLFSRSYAEAYERMKAGKPDAPDGMALSKRLASGIKLFFIHDAPLAIEMPASIRNSLLIESEKSISPAVLRGARAVTEASLRDSMHRFVSMNMGNSQRNRGWFGIFLGIATILIGAAFVTLCCLLDLHRAWRTFALFLFWFGALVAVASWGQLHPWEAARPKPSAISTMNASQHHRRTSSAGTATISSSSSSEYDEKQKYESVNSSPYTLNTSTFRSTPPSPTTPSYGACAYYNDTLLDSPKSPRLPTTWEGSQRTGTFAPMCKVEDPTVIREQRRRVFVAAIYGLFFAAVMAIPTFVPPNLHQ